MTGLNLTRSMLFLRADVLQAAKGMVQSGAADNLSAFVESAVEEKVRGTRKAVIYAAYNVPAADHEFQRSMTEASHDLAVTDADGLQHAE